MPTRLGGRPLLVDNGIGLLQKLKETLDVMGHGVDPDQSPQKALELPAAQKLHVGYN